MSAEHTNQARETEKQFQESDTVSDEDGSVPSTSASRPPGSPHQASIDQEIKDFQRAAEEIKKEVFDPFFEAFVEELSNSLAYTNQILSTMASLQIRAREHEDEKRALLNKVEEKLSVLTKGIGKPFLDAEQ